MFIHRNRIIVIWFFLASVVLSVHPVEAATVTLNRLNGTVYLVNLTGRTVTLQDVSGMLTTLNITRNSRILRNNRRATLAGLVLGDRASVLYDSRNNIRQLGLIGPQVTVVRGGVLDVSTGTGVVQTTRGSFSTNAQTRVVRNGRVSSLRSLTVRDGVSAHVATGSTGSQTVQSETEPDALDVVAEGPEESEIGGTIAAVNTEASTVTITPREGDGAVTVNVTVDTLIEACHEASSIADLTVGLFVEVVYAPVTLNAFRIDTECEGEEAEIEGVITAIDPTGGTVTITNGDGVAITLLVNASTKIERNEEPALLSDLLVGDFASAEFNAVTMVATEIEAGVEPEEEPEPEPEPEPEHD